MINKIIHKYSKNRSAKSIHPPVQNEKQNLFANELGALRRLLFLFFFKG